MALCTWYSAPEISHCMKIYVQTTYTILQPCPIAKACQQATNCRHTNMAAHKQHGVICSLNPIRKTESPSEVKSSVQGLSGDVCVQCCQTARRLSGVMEPSGCHDLFVLVEWQHHNAAVATAASVGAAAAAASAASSAHDLWPRRTAAVAAACAAAVSAATATAAQPLPQLRAHPVAHCAQHQARRKHVCRPADHVEDLCHRV